MVQFVSALMFGLLLTFADCQSSRDDRRLRSEELLSEDRTEKWGYVTVKPNGRMFYWLYYTSHPDGHRNRSWIIWLQGGPGESSTGYGNFETIGPLKADLTPRNTTWVAQASVLFVDSPLGAGFSYVENSTAYSKNMSEVVEDLIRFLRVFLRRTPDFKTIPLYIFGQSYGGKIAAHFAKCLHNENQKGTIEVRLVGVALGSAWISPLDSILNFAPFAYQMSVIDEKDRERIETHVKRVEDAISKEQWNSARRLFWLTLDAINASSPGLDILDISKFNSNRTNVESALAETMARLKTDKLLIIPPTVTWRPLNEVARDKLKFEFMKPSITVLEELHNNTDLQITVFQGQLDLVCNTKGANDWVHKLLKLHLLTYKLFPRTAFLNPVDNQTEFYLKHLGKFKFYTILGAGHEVPRDKGDATYRMLEDILRKLFVQVENNTRIDLSV